MWRSTTTLGSPETSAKASRRVIFGAKLNQGTVALRHDGIVAPCTGQQGTVAPWHEGTVASWHHGTKAPWHQSTMTPWHHSTKPCNVRMGSNARHILLSIGAGAGRALTEHLDARRVSYVQYVRHYQVLSIAFRPSHFVHGVNQKVALVYHALLALSCDIVVHERRSGFSDAVDAVGMGSSSTPNCPVRCSLQTMVMLALNPSAPSQADVDKECYLVDPACIHMLVSMTKPCMFKKLVVGLLDWPAGQPMVCTSRLVPSVGDALLALIERKLGARRQSDTVLVSTIDDADQGSADVAFRTLPAPYEKSKFLGSGGSMVARLKLKGIDGRAPPGVEPVT
ncbi:hypothetical protein FXO37_13674 [Capsicum annuum]|nr:hypothetical protein FXO37_13674 [Capsicum annuum]